MKGKYNLGGQASLACMRAYSISAVDTIAYMPKKKYNDHELCIGKVAVQTV